MKLVTLLNKINTKKLISLTKFLIHIFKFPPKISYLRYLRETPKIYRTDCREVIMHTIVAACVPDCLDMCYV